MVIKNTTANNILAKRRADLILSTSVAHPSFVLLSTVVLQIPPFANILPLAVILKTEREK